MKQGDPISALLFIAIVEACLRKCRAKWTRLSKRRSNHCFGIVIDDVNEPLTNLRFADDIMLISQSRADTAKMLSDLSEAAAKCGLHVHFGKTKVMTTQQNGGEMQGIKLTK